MPRAGSIWKSCRCSDAGTREQAKRELRDLPVGDLLAEATAAGIRLSAEGDRLRVRGPRGTEGLGRLLLERKAELLAVLAPRTDRVAEGTPGPVPSGECGFPTTDTAGWDAGRAAAIVAEVDALIDGAWNAAPIADNPARRNVLTNERGIVRRLARARDPFLRRWPQALHDLLARWTSWDAMGSNDSGACGSRLSNASGRGSTPAPFSLTKRGTAPDTFGRILSTGGPSAPDVVEGGGGVVAEDAAVLQGDHGPRRQVEPAAKPLAGAAAAAGRPAGRPVGGHEDAVQGHGGAGAGVQAAAQPVAPVASRAAGAPTAWSPAIRLSLIVRTPTSLVPKASTKA